MVIQYRFRLYLIALILLGAFSGLLFRLWDVQITNQNLYAEQVKPMRTTTVRVPGVRGEIKDRNGNLLVTNKSKYEIVLNLREIEQHYRREHRGKELPTVKRQRGTGFKRNVDVLDIVTVVNETVRDPLAELGLDISYDEEHLEKQYDVTRLPGLVPFSLFQDLTYAQFAVLQEQSLEIPGLRLQARPIRDYVYGSLAAHSLGYVRRADMAVDIAKLDNLSKGEGPEAEEARKWLRPDHIYEPDPFGVLGIEKSQDHWLQGRAGFREHLIDQKNVYVRESQNVPPKQGHDVILTLDLRAQYIVESALRKANGGRGIGRGAAALIDPNNGAVLALATVPSFDPNRFVPFITPEDFKHYREGVGKPLINRAVAPFAPGSTFKIPIAMAGGLKEGGSRFRWRCSGAVSFGGRSRPIRCMGTHFGIGLQNSIMKSCNSFYYKYANHIGIDNVIKVTDMFGLGQPSGVPIEEPAARRFVVPNPRWHEENNINGRLGPWSAVSVAYVGIGQGGVACSPLQMAQVAAIAANGGKCYQLRMVQRVVEPDGTLVSENTPKLNYDLTEHGISKEIIQTVRQGMWDVVNKAGGTARRARIDGIEVAGKTGTAQYNTQDGTHAWFVCFAPFDKPQYALCVFVEDGASGGRVAAPIAKRILEELFRGNTSTDFRRLEDAVGHEDVHEEITFEGDLWTAPEGEADTADTAVPVDGSNFSGNSGTNNSSANSPSPSVRERANIVKPPTNR